MWSEEPEAFDEVIRLDRFAQSFASDEKGVGRDPPSVPSSPPREAHSVRQPLPVQLRQLHPSTLPIADVARVPPAPNVPERSPAGRCLRWAASARYRSGTRTGSMVPMSSVESVLGILAAWIAAVVGGVAVRLSALLMTRVVGG